MAENWYDDYGDDDDEFEIDEYELTATPNDFNVLTINSFIESGAIKIPGFQRNYVWDIKRASKLIESLILGLPVPQVFLYEEARNSFLVIDGQQRLMSIYYFIRQRFPRKEKRSELRAIFDQHGKYPDEILHDDSYFAPFKLSLPDRLPNKPNKFKGLTYGMLSDYRGQFDLRPIRNVIVKQNKPSDDDSSVFEMFNRLNTGGINLRPQEIRISLYHSKFYDILYRLNVDPRWRRILNIIDPDVHMKDVEIILRGFAMLAEGADYRPSMPKFLNQFSRRCKTNSEEKNAYFEALFKSFLQASQQIPPDTFVSSRTKRFSIALYEAVFTALVRPAFERHELFAGEIDAARIRQLDLDPVFIEASEKASAGTSNVARRLERARIILGV